MNQDSFFGDTVNLINLAKKKKNVKKAMELPGIDPGASRMQSERSTK
jgi:hypothetical protein